MRSWLMRGAVVLGIAGILSAAYRAAAEARDRRRFRPPGRLVDVGGRFLHVLDIGQGSPAVIIVPAVGGNVLDWLAGLDFVIMFVVSQVGDGGSFLLVAGTWG